MKNKTVGIMAAATLLIGGAYMLNAKDRDSDRSDKTKRIYITYMKRGASEELVDAHVNGLAKVAGLTREQALDSMGMILRAITTTEFEREFETALRSGTGVIKKKHNLNDKQIKFVEGAGREMQTEVKNAQASTISKEKPSGREDTSELVIPEKFSNRVNKIGADLYRVGDVTIDSKLQVAVFPAKVNQIVGLIEYALVTDAGKVHESFLCTKIKPGNLHVALLLLGVNPKTDVSVEISWQKDGEWIRKSITDCIAQYPLEVASEVEEKETEKSFKLKPSWWKWTGSRVRPSGILAADELGSILSLQPDPDALSLIEPMIDTSRFGSHVWSEKVPKKDSMVQIFIQRIETEKHGKS